MLNKNKLFAQREVNVIPDVSKALSWLEAHPDALKGIGRGIERETLRVNPNGHLATTGHPESLGSALKHSWITTDFAETLLEFITPVDQSIDRSLAFLRDIHRHTARELGQERMWPFSMPGYVEDVDSIELAQYGSSNIGKMKTLYRQGLKNRYSALMQIISGVHYNFSLPLSFWQEWADVKDAESGKETISAGYLRLIRNYYRFGWVIPYLFGASPAICSSFLQGRESKLPFETDGKGTLWLPYATSLRLSDLGYTNKSQSGLGITFNSLDGYVAALKAAIKTPSEEYAAMGTKDADGNWLQLNTNVLQIENELYAPIRPKRVTRSGEAPSDALLRGGIEYIEVRSLDINPFSAIGVDANQARFLDLFQRRNTAAGRLQTGAITFLPPLAFALFYPRGFVMALGYAGVALSILALLLPSLLAWKSRQQHPQQGYRVAGGKPLLCVVFGCGVVIILVQVLIAAGMLPEVG